MLRIVVFTGGRGSSVLSKRLLQRSDVQLTLTDRTARFAAPRRHRRRRRDRGHERRHARQSRVVLPDGKGDAATSGPLLVELELQSPGFEVDHEITAKVLARRWSIPEVPIRYHPRSRAEGKKIGLRDWFRAIRTFFRWRNG